MPDLEIYPGEGYVTLTLNRPEQRNALSIELVGALTEALRAAEAAPDVKAVVVAATPPAFCAGADFTMLGELVRLPVEAIAHRVYKVFQGLVRTIIDLEIPVVATVGGPALGAGCDLALACDCRLVGPGARFEATWVRLGLLPAMGGMAILPSLVGLGRARSLLYRAEPVDAADAVEFGLAEAMTKDGQTLAELAADWLAPLLRADRTALMGIKGGTRRAALRMIADDLEYASSRQAMRIGSDPVRQRLSSLASRPRPA